MKISMATAKKRLAILWFSGFVVFLFVMVIQSIRGVYEDKVIESWGWLLPTIMPTLLMMMAVFVSDARRMSKRIDYVDKFFFRLAFFLSLLYLLCVSGSFLAQPFSELWPLELLQMSNIWLGPLQGLAAGALVVFFRQEESKNS